MACRAQNGTKKKPQVQKTFFPIYVPFLASAERSGARSESAARRVLLLNFLTHYPSFSFYLLKISYLIIFFFVLKNQTRRSMLQHYLAFTQLSFSFHLAFIQLLLSIYLAFTQHLFSLFIAYLQLIYSLSNNITMLRNIRVHLHNYEGMEKVIPLHNLSFWKVQNSNMQRIDVQTHERPQLP